MDSDSWLVLVSVVGGWGLAQVTEVWRDRRVRERDRQARQAELQRTTLLALQDALLEVLNLLGPVRGAVLGYIGKQRTSPMGGVTELRSRMAEALKPFEDAEARARLLVSRVEDDQVRRSATLFLDTAGSVLNLKRDSPVEEAREEQASEAYRRAIDRIGEVLRERY
jgi:hypothetical protein